MRAFLEEYPPRDSMRGAARVAGILVRLPDAIASLVAAMRRLRDVHDVHARYRVALEYFVHQDDEGRGNKNLLAIDDKVLAVIRDSIDVKRAVFRILLAR
jgi:hypothetical protein